MIWAESLKIEHLPTNPPLGNVAEFECHDAARLTILLLLSAADTDYTVAIQDLASVKAGECTVKPESGLLQVYNLTSVHQEDIRGVNAYTDLMSSYKVMRMDYMRIPRSSR